MILREFIEQEISLGNISCFEDFRSSSTLYFGLMVKLDLDEYEDYLDHDVVWAEIKINYCYDCDKTIWYKIEVEEDKE